MVNNLKRFNFYKDRDQGKKWMMKINFREIKNIFELETKIGRRKKKHGVFLSTLIIKYNLWFIPLMKN